jgi:hypothetical protein
LLVEESVRLIQSMCARLPVRDAVRAATSLRRYLVAEVFAEGRAVLFPSTTRAHVYGVPDREPAVGRSEIGTELVVEVRDCRALLEELILEPALGIARVPVSLVAVERGAALVTGHVA